MAIGITFSFIELSMCLFQDRNLVPGVFWFKKSIRINWIIRLIALTGILFCFVLNWISPSWLNLDYIFIINDYGVLILIPHFVLVVLLLLILESAYRSYELFQRRLYRMYFLALFVIVIFQLVFLTRTLFYKTITRNYIDTGIVAYGICFPVLMYGLVRFRLWSEKIVVSRNLLNSSFTLLSVGAILIGLGISSFIIKQLGLTYTYFEIFLVAFSLFFFSILVLGSSPVRKRISRALNRRFYTRKYDYQQQFFRLHDTYLSTDDIRQSVTRLVEDIKETLNAANIYVFMLDKEDGNYHILQNPDARVPDDIRISGDSPFVASYTHNDEQQAFRVNKEKSRELVALEKEDPLIRSLDISAVFPVMHEHALLGFIAFKHTKGLLFDDEDVKLIQVYSRSLGNIFFQHRILKERIEHKQFESFNHIASFIIHDIKNQVSTLSLLIKNAQTNINNPEFQKSLLKSLNNCAANLQTLVNKFKAPPREDALCLKPENINDSIQEVIAATNIQALNTLTLNVQLRASQPALVDKNSLMYVFMNLITNALEAMECKGCLSVVTDDCSNVQKTVLKDLNISEHVLSGKKSICTISDTGKGMTREFVETKLFRPFSTTKDKGIGIGLYQCRMLIEKMGGRIFCKSELNKGTTFYILL